MNVSIACTDVFSFNVKCVLLMPSEVFFHRGIFFYITSSLFYFTLRSNKEIYTTLIPLQVKMFTLSCEYFWSTDVMRHIILVV